MSKAGAAGPAAAAAARGGLPVRTGAEAEAEKAVDPVAERMDHEQDRHLAAAVARTGLGTVQQPQGEQRPRKRYRSARAESKLEEPQGPKAVAERTGTSPQRVDLASETTLAERTRLGSIVALWRTLSRGGVFLQAAVTLRASL